MKTCKSCGTTYDDDLALCPSCGVHAESEGTPRADESTLSKDRWGTNDSSPPRTRLEATQQLLPRKAPVKKGVTQKPAKDSSTYHATMTGMGPDSRAADEAVVVDSENALNPGVTDTLVFGNPRRSSRSASQATVAIGTTKPDLEPTRKLRKGKRSSSKVVRQPTQVLREETPPEPPPLELDTPKSPSEDDRSADARPFSSSPAKAAWEIDAISSDLEKNDKVEVLVQSEMEIDFSPDSVKAVGDIADDETAPHRVGALSRDDDSRFAGRSDEETALPGRSRQKPRQPTRKRAGNVPSLSVSLGISSAILISTWLIPNVFSGKPVFPFDLVASTHGLNLVALLAEPTCGALLLALILLPVSPRLQATASLGVGFLALSIPLLFGSPALPLPGATVLAVACIDIAVAVLIFVFLRIPALGHFALLLVPGVLFATSVFGVVSDRLPAAHLSLFKAPLNIYASMLITGLAAAALIGAARDKKARS